MNGAGDSKQRMPVRAALEHLAQTRTNSDIIVTNQSSARLWPRLSQHSLDFNYNPSNMGGAVPFALGLAVSQPERNVTVLSGDGSLLMNLGCLVTVIGSRATNITILLLDNSMYEVTGGQRTPASDLRMDYAALARAAGFRNIDKFFELEDWYARSVDFLASPGPRFGWLSVGPTPSEVFGDTLPPIARRTEQFRIALRR
jgi:thiamine pyrophosphate-dependent acetolactate synthase large subunit-like protein